MQNLNNIIKGNINSEIETIINGDNSNESQDQEKESFIDDIKINFDNADWMEWSNSVLDAAKRIADESECGSVINACYNPEFVKQFKTRLLLYLPIWTGIMRPYFKRSSEIVSSSSVEAEFCDLKHRGFKGQLPMRVDKFIVQHLDFLDAKITLASNENDVATKDTSLQLNNQDTTYELMEVDASNPELSSMDIESDNNDNEKSVKQFVENIQDNVTDVSSDISIKSSTKSTASTLQLNTNFDNKNN